MYEDLNALINPFDKYTVSKLKNDLFNYHRSAEECLKNIENISSSIPDSYLHDYNTPLHSFKERLTQEVRSIFSRLEEYGGRNGHVGKTKK